MRPLAGKTALVTGAARGIGRAIALRLASKQVNLALADRDEVGLARTRVEIERLGAEAIVCRCDLTEPAEIAALVDAMHARWAGVDLLVNNAGIAHYGPTHEMTPAESERLMAVNLHAPMRLTHALLPAMLARPEAHVLNVGSVLGLSVMPRVSAYCASKHALVGFSEALRVEYGRQGLGVTTLCPGFVRTELIDEASVPPSGHAQRRPPALVCVRVERVAHAAVRGIERNRRRVVVDPVGRIIRGAMALTPSVFDWMHSLGRHRRIAKKRDSLRALHPDQQQALRLHLGTQDRGTEDTPAQDRRLAA